MLKVRNLSYQYKKSPKPALTDINLTFSAGALALIGPNGAGKSTLIGLLSGLLEPTTGSVIFEGELSAKPISVVPQELAFYEELSVIENLNLFSRIVATSYLQEAPAQMVERVIEQCGLASITAKKARLLSGGQKRKLNLAIGLLAHAPVLFLDEPTVGIDIESRQEILNLLRTYTANGNQLLYTSHQLHEIETLCDQITFLKSGKLILQPTPISSLASNSNLMIQSTQSETIYRTLEQSYSLDLPESNLLIVQELALSELPPLLERLLPHQHSISLLNYGKNSLDSFYFSLVNGSNENL